MFASSGGSSRSYLAASGPKSGGGWRHPGLASWAVAAEAAVMARTAEMTRRGGDDLMDAGL